MAASDGYGRALLQKLFERGPLTSEGLERAMDMGGLDAHGIEAWAQDALGEGLIEPAAAVPGGWQITDAGRRAIGNEPGL